MISERAPQNTDNRKSTEHAVDVDDMDIVEYDDLCQRADANGQRQRCG